MCRRHPRKEQPMNTEALARKYGKPVQEQNAEVEYLFTLEGVEALLTAERERACRIVTGLCISDNNAHEINEAIRGRPANAHDKVYSEVDLANAYQKGWDDDAAPDMISVVDETGRYRMVNDAWCRANRLARKDVIGRHVRQVAPEMVIPERRKELVECLLERNPLSVRHRMELADRGMADLEIDYYPFGDDLGQVRHVMMVCRDVSAREAVLRAAKEAEADKLALREPGHRSPPGRHTRGAPKTSPAARAILCLTSANNAQGTCT
jgi:PAS domain S-box-containing protein